MCDTAELNEQQREVLRLVDAGCNVFFTGSAGTGKSFMLERIVERLRERHGDDFRRRVAVTATTGVAATHIGGQTLNSALGLGAPSLVGDFRSLLAPRNRGRVRDWDTLIVDEISMMSGEFLEQARRG